MCAHNIICKELCPPAKIGHVSYFKSCLALLGVKLHHLSKRNKTGTGESYHVSSKREQPDSFVTLGHLQACIQDEGTISPGHTEDPQPTTCKMSTLEPDKVARQSCEDKGSYRLPCLPI